MSKNRQKQQSLANANLFGTILEKILLKNQNFNLTISWRRGFDSE